MEIDNQETLDKISHLSIVLQKTRHEVVQAAIDAYFIDKNYEIRLNNTVEDCITALTKEFTKLDGTPLVTNFKTGMSPDGDSEILLHCDVDALWEETLSSSLYHTVGRVCEEHNCHNVQLMDHFIRE
jgi:hypothetical protein